MNTRRSNLFFLAASSVFAGAAVAQTTWVVDANNGPGTHFPDLPPALAAAADGDTIRVRAGAYTPGSTGKALAILGDPGATLRAGPLPMMTVTGLPAGKTFLMKGVEAVPNQYGSFMKCSDNAGRIHLENLKLEIIPPAAPELTIPVAFALAIENCSEVSITGCSLFGGSALSVRGSTVTVTSTVIRGSNAGKMLFVGTPLASHPGLAASESTVILSHAGITGGDGYFNTIMGPLPPAPAVSVAGGRTVVAGDSAITWKSGSGSLTVPAIKAAGGYILRDPSVNLIGTPPIEGASLIIVRRLSALRSRGAPPGGAISSELYSENGHLEVLLGSRPADPVDTFMGQLWLDAAGLFLFDVGVQGPGEHRTTTTPVPLDASLVGLPITLQALSGPSVAELALSTPAVIVLH